VVVIAAKKAEVRDSLNLRGVVEHRAHPCGVAVDLALDVRDVERTVLGVDVRAYLLSSAVISSSSLTRWTSISRLI
jgi:hypothetical protein